MPRTHLVPSHMSPCAQALADGQPQQPRELRITPFRSFFPGQLYEPTVRLPRRTVSESIPGS